QARIEIDERLQSLQRDAGMLNAAAARGDVEHRILHRAVDDAARAQSAAALRREQAEILAVESEAQIEPLVDAAIERDVGAAEVDAHLLELPGFVEARELAAAADRHSAQPSA